MAKLSKRIHAFQDKVEKGKYYSVQDAVNLLKEVSSVKFDESCAFCNGELEWYETDVCVMCEEKYSLVGDSMFSRNEFEDDMPDEDSFTHAIFDPDVPSPRRTEIKNFITKVTADGSHSACGWWLLVLHDPPRPVHR